MNRSEANEKAKQHISNAGFGTGTNITTHALKCMMVDFYLDNQVKNLGIANVSNRRELFDKFYAWLDGLSQSEYDEMSLTEKCEKFFFKT